MRKTKQGAAKAAQLRAGEHHPFGMLAGVQSLGGAETALYESMRQALPLLDAAIGKLVRLTGGFDVTCADKRAEKGLRQFLRSVSTGRGQYGMESFLSAFLQSMLV